MRIPAVKERVRRPLSDGNREGREGLKQRREAGRTAIRRDLQPKRPLGFLPGIRFDDVDPPPRELFDLTADLQVTVAPVPSPGTPGEGRVRVT